MRAEEDDPGDTEWILVPLTSLSTRTLATTTKHSSVISNAHQTSDIAPPPQALCHAQEKPSAVFI